ncbi:MAG: RNA pseudouridine synthase [Rhizobiales bacterium NRL2]|jgi:23S rRNA pseudouridine955/2504/2580 synthase|nr:MAG: RNA pseudouridine synthase [Rhizobiales bacterium NRL2]
MSGVRQERVKRDEDGMRLDRWFRARFPEVTQGRLQKMLRKGEIRLDGGRVKADQRVASGQTVRVPPLGDAPPSAPKDRDGGVSEADRKAVMAMVIYRDPEVIVLNKPAGLAVQGGTRVGRHVDAMLPALQFDAGEPPRLVHRLDKDTSGVLVLARTRQAAQWLTRAFRDRDTEKTYWAITVGVPRPRRGEIDLRLSKEGGPRGERVEPVPEGGQRAISHFTVIDEAGTRAAWLAMRPVTGRTHQLRVHAAAIGCPVIGDGKYGGEKAHPGGFAPTLHLHARRIVLARPDGRKLDVTADPPKAFLEGLDLLGFDPNDPEATIDWAELAEE